MAIYWMTEALPLPVTSLIPVVALPLFGIMETGDVSTAYMKANLVIFSFLRILIYCLFYHLSFPTRKTNSAQLGR